MSAFVRQSVNSLTGYTPGEQPIDPSVIKLNTNENPYPPSPAVVAAMRGLNSDTLRLYPDPMAGQLRERIAAIHGSAVENVFVGNGCDEILALCTRAFVEDGEAIGYFDPSYSLYPVLAAIRNVRTAPVALDDEFNWPSEPGGSGSGIMRATMEYLGKCAAKLFYLTNPNAPSGRLYAKEQVRDFCREFQGVVLIDEAYVDFSERNCIELCMTMGNVLVARTMSKAFSLAGIRIGYAIGPEPLVSALFKLKDSYNTDRISQKLAFAALSDLEYTAECARKIIATRKRLTGLLTKRGMRVVPSQANFLWVKPRDIRAIDLYGRLKSRKILVRHFDTARTRDYLRITVGTDEQIDILVDALDSIRDDSGHGS